MSSRPLSVGIVYGFSEGPILSRKLRKVLTKAGYEITNNMSKADVLIAHSAGCYMVPADNHAISVMNIGYPYMPGRSLGTALHIKLADEYRRLGLLRFLKKNSLNGLLFLNIPQTRRSIAGWKLRKQYLEGLHQNQIFVRNHVDPLCKPKALMQAAGDNHTYISIPGYHDHLWVEPEIYVNLLKSLV